MNLTNLNTAIQNITSLTERYGALREIFTGFHAPCVRLVVASLDNLGGGNERMTWEDITKQFKVKR